MVWGDLECRVYGLGGHSEFRAYGQLMLGQPPHNAAH